jgi:hypothetical protein
MKEKKLRISIPHRARLTQSIMGLTELGVLTVEITKTDSCPMPPVPMVQTHGLMIRCESALAAAQAAQAHHLTDEAMVLPVLIERIQHMEI